MFFSMFPLKIAHFLQNKLAKFGHRIRRLQTSHTVKTNAAHGVLTPKSFTMCLAPDLSTNYDKSGFINYVKTGKEPHIVRPSDLLDTVTLVSVLLCPNVIVSLN